MLQKLKKLMKKEKGFTLVELLAVIVILGIILAIAVPAVGNVIGKAEEEANDASIELVENAARLADISGIEPDETDAFTVDYLVESGYLEEAPEGLNGKVVITEDDEENGGAKTYKYE
ncbi:type II secretion system protein [Oceanobacillus massiliensis]|uniref:competence type IV pilus major pilin ComGC n=1 Tax=Oceanobacillus massiliensis TaxID=1465765 RepID=UPI0030187969